MAPLHPREWRNAARPAAADLDRASTARRCVAYPLAWSRPRSWSRFFGLRTAGCSRDIVLDRHQDRAVTRRGRADLGAAQRPQLEPRAGRQRSAGIEIAPPAAALVATGSGSSRAVPPARWCRAPRRPPSKRLGVIERAVRGNDQSSVTEYFETASLDQPMSDIVARHGFTDLRSC